MSNHILSYWEHCSPPFRNATKTCLSTIEAALLTKDRYLTLFPKTHGNKDDSKECFRLQRTDTLEPNYQLSTSYFVGVDWVEQGDTAIYVAPKFNKEDTEIDYISMLFSSLENSETQEEINELFIVKWDEPQIYIEQQQDLLTPLLVIEYLNILKKIVQKGLKKSYYKIEKNLHSRIKGKVLIAKNLKRNKLQNKQLHTYCSFDEFGLNNLENRLLKKALVFVKKYLPTYTHLSKQQELQNLFNYISPSFHSISDKIELTEIKYSKTNPFYKEYSAAIRLAKIILKRFGYNLSNTTAKQIKTPPFWIDMSKLFELHVLSLLRKRFPHRDEIIYQKEINGYFPDYLLKSKDGAYKIIIDAKYKNYSARSVQIDDIRQVSGYARMKGVYNKLDKKENEIIDCLIVYPDNKSPQDLLLTDLTIEKNQLKNYFNIFKIGIEIPTI